MTGTRQPTDLAPIVVERVARRVAHRNRRAGQTMLATAAVGASASSLAI